MLSPKRIYNLRYFTTDQNSRTSNLATPQETIEKKSGPQSYRRLLKLTIPEIWSLSGGIGLLFVSSGITMSVPFIIGALIDSIYGGGSLDAIDGLSTAVSTPPNDAAAISATHIPNVKSDLSLDGKYSLEQVCGILGAVFIVGGIANAGRVYLMTTAGQRISQSLRSSLFSSLMNQESYFFDKHKTGELVSRLAADTPIVATVVTTTVSDAVRSAIMSVAAMGMMLYTSPQLSLFGLSVVPPIALTAALAGRKLKTLSTKVQAGLGECTQHAEERLSNFRTVRLFAQEMKETKNQDELLRKTLKIMYAEAKMKGAFFGMTGLSGNLVVLSVLYKGSSLVVADMLSIGSLSSFLMYAAYVGISVSGLAGAYSELSKGAGAADRVFEIIDRKPLMSLHGGTLLDASLLKGDVEFKEVNFSYPTRSDAPIFCKFNLSVPSGSVVAVVGESGCGKSTVISLLLRLYDPASGSILLDGIDIRELDPISLRSAIGVVSQEPVLFSGTIRDNIVYGAPYPDSISLDRIEEAAHQANALEFIKNFPEGFSTIVGERGVLVSGGQKQRLAIARALITNPRILCLDEATSALDSESERLVQEAIERLMVNRTVITIAHRLSTVKTADQIAVLQKGCVVELGSYSELLQNNAGVFKRLVSRQALVV